MMCKEEYSAWGQEPLAPAFSGSAIPVVFAAVIGMVLNTVIADKLTDRLIQYMIGIETVAPAAEVVKKCNERGVLCLTAKHKVRLLPALNIPQELLEEAVQTVKAVAAELAAAK